MTPNETWDTGMSEIKIASALNELMAAPDSPEEHRVIVRFRLGLSVASRPLAGVAAQHFALLPATAMRATAREIRALAASPQVERIWPDLQVHTCLESSVPHIRAPAVWDAGYTGRGVGVAILDTGIDAGHPDFAGRLVAMQDFTGEGVRDNHGHGTHVAGIAAAGANLKGVAPGADIFVAKVLHDDGTGYMSEVMAGLDWAVQQQVRVVNLSLGGAGPCDGSDALSTACDAAVDRGVMVCVAAGNFGPEASSVGPPGCARKPLTVGACSIRDTIASFSARGPTSDGRVKPDIVMPGVNITSCRAQGTRLGTPVSDLYTRTSGTSMATPHATGTVALLLEASPELTAEQLKHRLMDAAKDLGLDANAQGQGRGDAYQSYVGESYPQPAAGCLASALRFLATGR